MNSLLLGYVGTLPKIDGTGCAQSSIDRSSGYPYLSDGLNLRTSLVDALEDLRVIKGCKNYSGSQNYDWDREIIGSVIVQPLDQESVDDMVTEDIMSRATGQFTMEELKIIAQQFTKQS